MPVRTTIAALHEALENTISEQDLSDMIDDRRPRVRLLYLSGEQAFTSADVEFLKTLGSVSDHLRAFIELKEELPLIDSVVKYENVINRLNRLKSALGLGRGKTRA